MVGISDIRPDRPSAIGHHSLADVCGESRHRRGRLHKGVHSCELTNLHAVLIARCGKPAVECCYAGSEVQWGTKEHQRMKGRTRGDS